MESGVEHLGGNSKGFVLYAEEIWIWSDGDV